MRALGPVAAALAAALLAPAALAQGIVVPRHRERHPLPTPRPPAAAPLEVRSLAVETTITGRVATTRIDQVFFNPSEAELEGTYLFPLPEGAAVEKFSMFVDGTEVAGELLDATRARGIYEAIVRSRRDPALLEFVGTRLFRASIFPIPPRSEKRVKLSYSEMLRGDSGSSTWRFPLGNSRHAPAPLRRASVVVEIAADRRLASVFSPTHKVDIVRKDERRVRVSWEEAEVRPDRDFTLLLQEPAGELGFSFAAHRPAGEDGTFLLLLAPAVEADAKPIARDVVFCLDTSGSMAGEKMEQARNALRHGIRSLNPEDRFAIVAFATEPRLFREALVPAGAAEREAALAFADGLRAVGGTCIDDALQASLGLLEGGDAARPGVLFFVTDGLPTIGEREPAVILEKARKRASARVRAFAFGVGYDVNASLLDRLAEEMRGTRDYVAPTEDIEQKVSALVAKTTHPAMTDVTLAVEGPAVHDLYPRPLPDLFRGSELAVLGRYAAGGKAVVRVKGKVREGVREFVNEVTFPDREEGASFLGRLWAIRRVGHLLDEIRLRGETRELRDEVLRLATRHGILTPYTSYLVLENEEMLQRFGARDDAAVRALRGLAGAAPGGGSFGAPEAPAPAPEPAATGKHAVDRSLEVKRLREAESLGEEGRSGRDAMKDLLRVVEGKSFFLRDGVWEDSGAPRDAARRKVVAYSDEYLELAAKDRVLARAFALGRVIVRSGGVVYEVVEAL